MARTGRPPGRPKGSSSGPYKEINVQMLEVMCRAQEYRTVIADSLGVSVDTLERRYGEEMKKWYADGKMSLRRQMYLAAMSGNTTLQIFYAKNYLGMSDQPEPQVHVHSTTESLGIDEKTARRMVLDRLKQMDERIHAHPDKVPIPVPEPITMRNGGRANGSRNGH